MITVNNNGYLLILEPCRKKTFGLPYQVRHKPGCTTTEDDSRLESSDLDGDCLCSKNKGADQLRAYRTADLHLCFCICKSRFSGDAAHYKLTNEPWTLVS